MRGGGTVRKLRICRTIGRLRLVPVGGLSSDLFSDHMLKATLTSKAGEFAQGLTYSHPHPEEVLFWNPTGFPLLGLSTVASCVYPKLSIGNTGNSRRQSSTCELKLPSCISYLSPCKKIQVTVLPRLALHYTTWNCLHYCSSSEGEIRELHVVILLLAVPYVPDFLNSVFERVLVVQLYPLYLYCFMLVSILDSLFFSSQLCFITTSLKYYNIVSPFQCIFSRLYKIRVLHAFLS